MRKSESLKKGRSTYFRETFGGDPSERATRHGYRMDSAKHGMTPLGNDVEVFIPKSESSVRFNTMRTETKSSATTQKARRPFVAPQLKRHDELPMITAGSIQVIRVDPYHLTKAY